MAPKRPDDTDQTPPKEEVQLENRVALSPKEAAKALGISERCLRSNLHDIPYFRLGSRILIPIDMLRESTRDWVYREKSKEDQATQDILRSFEDSTDDE